MAKRDESCEKEMELTGGVTTVETCARPRCIAVSDASDSSWMSKSLLPCVTSSMLKLLASLAMTGGELGGEILNRHHIYVSHNSNITP